MNLTKISLKFTTEHSSIMNQNSQKVAMLDQKMLPCTLNQLHFNSYQKVHRRDTTFEEY